MSDEPLPPPGATLGIAEVAELTGLSKDTLRWYERRGLIRAVDRTTGGRRRYDAEQVRLVLLLVRLRREVPDLSDPTLRPGAATRQGDVVTVTRGSCTVVVNLGSEPLRRATEGTELLAAWAAR